MNYDVNRNGYWFSKEQLEEHDKQIRADAIDEFRKYLKSVRPCEIPQEYWDMGVDNTCDRMLKEQNNDTR